jgi:hypothetical protein
MKRLSTILLSALLFSTLAAMAQAPPMPKPGPEQKNLAYFAGNWTTTGDIKPGPFGPGGKYTDTQHMEWMPGGFFLIAHMQSTMGPVKMTSAAVYGYDAEKKLYTYDEYNSNGEALHATGTFDGKVWTWSSDQTMGGKQMKSHFIETVTSPTSFTFKFEMSQDGGNNWAQVMEGTSTKTASTGTAKKK